MNPTDWLRLGVEQYLRDLPDEELEELMQLVRPPGGKAADDGRAAFARNLFGGGND
ncbi:hypothetical protein MYSE111917_01215 [Mycobacterium senriense]|uniref:Uncharacterized protein n=1 Tax=Mycobacterium senriense TaxID=2775496 RepID=A0ABN6IRP4_9MYCO|nr:hypothetical protein MTY59_46020 [Mycobacterium senriense]